MAVVEVAMTEEEEEEDMDDGMIVEEEIEVKCLASMRLSLSLYTGSSV